MKCSSMLVADTWTVDDLISRVGSVTRSAALKALATWVDLHVLKENDANEFRLLSVSEESEEDAQFPATNMGMPLL